MLLKFLKKFFICKWLIIRAVQKKAQNLQKKVRKTFGSLDFLPLLCTRNREINAVKSGSKATKSKVLKNFLKKVSEKFGGYKKTPYLCTTFALQNVRRRKNRKRWPKGLIKQKSFFEVFEQLNKFFPSLRKKRNFKNNTFEIRAKI